MYSYVWSLIGQLSVKTQPVFKIKTTRHARTG